MWWMKSFLDETQKWQTGKISKTSPRTVNFFECDNPAELNRWPSYNHILKTKRVYLKLVDGILLRSKSKMANWKKISEMSPNCELSLSIITLQNYIQSCLKDEKSTSI